MNGTPHFYLFLTFEACEFCFEDFELWTNIPTSLMMIKIKSCCLAILFFFATTISSIKEINYYLDMNQFCIILCKLSILFRISYED